MLVVGGARDSQPASLLVDPFSQAAADHPPQKMTSIRSFAALGVNGLGPGLNLGSLSFENRGAPVHFGTQQKGAL